MMQKICLAGAALVFLAALYVVSEGDKRAMKLCQENGYSFSTCHRAIYR